MEATSTRRRICARHARSIPHVFSPREIRVKALRGQRSWIRIFQGALFLTRAAAHVPPFAFVLLQKTADSRERNRRKEKACLPLIPRRFRLQRSRQPRARRALLSCSLLSLGFKCAIRARRFSSAFVKNKSKRRDTSGEHQKKSQPSHRKRLKTAENKGFLTFLNAMGRSVPLKTPIRFQIANKINGFVHVSYGTALERVQSQVFYTNSNSLYSTIVFT